MSCPKHHNFSEEDLKTLKAGTRNRPRKPFFAIIFSALQQGLQQDRHGLSWEENMTVLRVDMDEVGSLPYPEVSWGPNPTPSVCSSRFLSAGLVHHRGDGKQRVQYFTAPCFGVDMTCEDLSAIPALDKVKRMRRANKTSTSPVKRKEREPSTLIRPSTSTAALTPVAENALIQDIRKNCGNAAKSRINNAAAEQRLKNREVLHNLTSFALSPATPPQEAAARQPARRPAPRPAPRPAARPGAARPAASRPPASVSASRRAPRPTDTSTPPPRKREESPILITSSPQHPNQTRSNPNQTCSNCVNQIQGEGQQQVVNDRQNLENQGEGRMVVNDTNVRIMGTGAPYFHNCTFGK